MASQGLLRIDKLTGIYEHRKVTHFLYSGSKRKVVTLQANNRVQCLHNHEGNSLAYSNIRILHNLQSFILSKKEKKKIKEKRKGKEQTKAIYIWHLGKQIHLKAGNDTLTQRTESQFSNSICKSCGNQPISDTHKKAQKMPAEAIPKTQHSCLL